MTPTEPTPELDVWRADAESWVSAYPDDTQHPGPVQARRVLTLLAAFDEARRATNRENAQMIGVQDELHEALVSITEHKAATADMRRRKEAAEARATAAERALEEAECHIQQLTESRDRAERIAEAAEARLDTCVHSWHDGRSPGPCPGCGYLRPRDRAVLPAVPATEGGEGK